MYKIFKFNSARNSFKYLIKFFNIKEIHMPYYLCDVMRHSAVSENCKPIFYHINDNFMPDTEFSKSSFILYPNYFGICENNTVILSQKYPNLIIDNAHSFLSKPLGLSCFNSFRKFFQNQNESYLYIKTNAPIKSINAIISKEMKIENTKRIKCFKFYNSYLGKNNLLNINMENITSPFCYPFLAETDNEADNLAHNLEKEGKIIYRYWNQLPKTYNEYKFYRRLVPIPLDNFTL